jgi:hypothetical protein
MTSVRRPIGRLAFPGNLEIGDWTDFDSQKNVARSCFGRRREIKWVRPITFGRAEEAVFAGWKSPRFTHELEADAIAPVEVPIAERSWPRTSEKKRLRYLS